MFRKMTAKNKNGILRAIVIGRVSTLQQQQSNIEAGYQYVDPFLKQLYDGPIACADRYSKPNIRSQCTEQSPGPRPSLRATINAQWE